MTWVHHHPGQLLLAAALTVLSVTGCGDGDESPVPAPDASAYVAAITPFLPVADPDDRPKVFVAPRDEPFSLEEQVAIIETIGDGYDVTFVDDSETVVDANAEGHPVQGEGLLIVLGRIPVDPPYVVRVESYRGEGDESATLVTLVRRGDHWAVATEESVEPEAVIFGQ
jgi:hypothetical protein